MNPCNGPGNGNNSPVMNGETLINVDNLSRHFGEQCAVNDISFTVQRGEVLGFLGPNGAGKTTTMQMICGILAATAGKVSIAGHDIVEHPKQAKTHIGFLPETPPLYTDLTVDEYLRYCAQLHHIDKANLSSALSNSKARCGLNNVGRRLIKNLSKGFQQRVGIAQAIIHSPAVVILDEPTSGLDPNQIVEIRQLISELADDHSVILSTHILPEVQGTCHRVLIIDKGKLIMDKPMSELHDNDEQQTFSAAFRHPPTIEELEGISGVKHVLQLDKTHFRICYKTTDDIPVILSEHAAKNAWGLYELVPETDSLENIFIQLTRGEPA